MDKMLTRENFSKNTTVAADSSVGQSENSNNNEELLVTMVNNNTTSSSSGDSVGSGITITTTPNVDNHNKLILKLPKATADQEVATSSSSSSSSSAVQSDTRKVEPLKINLLQHTSNSNNNNNNSSQTVPKITIKPIFPQANTDTAISSDCSSSAEEEVQQRDSSVDSSSPNSPNEPHIVPKLTIRSAEEGGTAHSSIVPKLTIKMNEAANSSSTTASANNANVLPPPLPKLTIKTMLDGSSGAIISSLSPASSSSSSYSNSSGNATVSSTAGTTSGGTNIVPKLTIKTNASGACVSSTEEQQESKLPKLTIKTGQEHAMIITQHSNDASSMQSIPKMTIKTKTLRAEDEAAAEVRDDEQMGKIPKLTIKANEDMGPLSPLVVRNMPQNESADRVPKLMISRQQDNNLMTVNNHFDAKINLKSNHCLEESPKSNKKNNCSIDEQQEKVPKLTIKHLNVVTEESHEAATMNKSIPKLTIKNLCSPNLKMKAVLDEEKLLNCNELINHNNNININNKTATNTDNQLDSDDMDIDEALKAHDPKIFNNVSTMFNDFGKSSPNITAAGTGLLTTTVRRVIDTVDLTSSPDRSPAHTTQTPQVEPMIKSATATPLLLERLQRDTSVIQSTMATTNHQLDSNTNINTNTSFLLNQLNAPLAIPNLKRHPTLPLVLNNRLFQQQIAQQQQQTNKTLKYPNLTERLMANGMNTLNTLVTDANNAIVPTSETLNKRNENVIDSIEILDTPDGSSQSSLDENASVESVNEPMHQFKNGIYLREQPISPKKYTHSENNPLQYSHNDLSHAKTNKSPVENSPDITPNKIRRVDQESVKKLSPQEDKIISPTYKCNNMANDESCVIAANTNINSTHRSRKQKHENLLPVPLDEEDPLKLYPMHENVDILSKNSNNNATEVTVTPVARKRGRPKKNPLAVTPAATPKSNNDQSCKSRRVQLLRKRLAIDMVAAEQPFEDEANEVSKNSEKDRSLRTPVRAARNGMTSTLASGKRGRRSLASKAEDMGKTSLNHFGGSNSSLSSSCSNSSLSSTTITTTTAAKIDLTRSSSSSSTNSCSQTTTTLTNVKAKNNTMLPPSKILSSDPVPDVVFKHNDFSSALEAQQFQMHNSGQSSEEIIDADLSSHIEDSLSPYKTPARGRGRGRGSRGARGSATSTRGTRGGHRISRGASAVAKAIAMSRPRCVGGLKHTPDPKRLKGLVSPGPQVFEEDTRMSADLTLGQLQQQQQQSQHSSESTQQSETNPSVVRQLEFFNNDESQSSVISNTSILDPNIVAAMQNGASSVLKQRPKKKKMEVCVAEDTECNVSSIAEYDWPPPKGCCPSKHRDTFMIQEQVALYLGIKSFKRKYPDLPRRQIDMEERNWLQEKNLVSERMCDLGITAVWASDILDIMYADFYDKYEEYKDYVRQKHLREIEAKQKALGMNILGNGRNLQMRERAMLSASKWNSYCGRARKSERVACLDMQSFIVNVPIPITAPAHTMVHREMADIITEVAAAERIPEPPTLLPKRVIDMTPKIEKSYPLALIPGQYCEHFRRFEPSELYALPLNTSLLDVTKLNDVDIAAELPKDLKHSNREKRQKRCQRQTKIQNTAEESDIESDSSSSSKGSRTSDSSSSSSSSSSDSDSSSDDEEIIYRCGVCQRTQNSNLKELPETFIKCYSCAKRVHPSCIEMPQRMVARVRNYNWQCAGCKCCIKCKRRQDTNKMLFCEQCDRGYHIYCLGLKSVPDGRWSCERCCVCMRCGATKPEGLPKQQLSPNNGEKVKQVKHKKVKWINEYRIDHITKLREHCYMMCVPCARAKPANKRVHIITPPANHKNTSAKVNNHTTPIVAATGTGTTTVTNSNETNVIKTTNKNNIVKINNNQSLTTTITNNVTTVKTTTATVIPTANIKSAVLPTTTIQRAKQQQTKQSTNKTTTTDVGDISLAGGTAIPPPPVVA